jgi:hypothetical protein
MKGIYVSIFTTTLVKAKGVIPSKPIRTSCNQGAVIESSFNKISAVILGTYHLNLFETSTRPDSRSRR